MTAVVLVEALVIALLVVLVVGLLRSHAEILRALHDAGINLEDGQAATPGSFAARPDEAVRATDDPASLGSASDIVGRTPTGELASVAVAGGSGRALVAFLSSGCLTCGEFWEALGDPDRRSLGAEVSRYIVVTHGETQESPARVAELAPRGVTTIMSSEAFEHYGVPGSPYFVLVNRADSRIVGEGVASSWQQLDSLVSKAAADSPVGRTRREMLSAARRSLAIDDQLRAAGVEPGDPSLYPDND